MYNVNKLRTLISLNKSWDCWSQHVISNVKKYDSGIKSKHKGFIYVSQKLLQMQAHNDVILISAKVQIQISRCKS